MRGLTFLHLFLLLHRLFGSRALSRVGGGSLCLLCSRSQIVASTNFSHFFRILMTQKHWIPSKSSLPKTLRMSFSSLSRNLERLHRHLRPLLKAPNAGALSGKASSSTFTTGIFPGMHFFPTSSLRTFDTPYLHGMNDGREERGKKEREITSSTVRVRKKKHAQQEVIFL